MFRGRGRMPDYFGDSKCEVCLLKVASRDLNLHLENKCSERMVTCVCGRIFKASVFETHNCDVPGLRESLGHIRSMSDLELARRKVCELDGVCPGSRHVLKFNEHLRVIFESFVIQREISLRTCTDQISEISIDSCLSSGVHLEAVRALSLAIVEAKELRDCVSPHLLLRAHEVQREHISRLIRASQSELFAPADRRAFASFALTHLAEEDADLVEVATRELHILDLALAPPRAPASLVAAIEANECGALQAAMDRCECSPNASMRKGGVEQSLVHLAIRAGATESLSVLLTSRADVHHPCHGRSPLIMAAQSGRVDLATLLLAAGARVEGALHAACESLSGPSHIDGLACVRLLLDSAADVSACTAEGETPLHTVLLCPHSPSALAALCALLDCGPPLDARLGGLTPLHLALQRRAPLAVVSALLEAGADVHAESAGTGEAGVDLAIAFGCEAAVVAALEARGGRRTGARDLDRLCTPGALRLARLDGPLV